jgi:hypothetical protein
MIPELSVWVFSRVRPTPPWYTTVSGETCLNYKTGSTNLTFTRSLFTNTHKKKVNVTEFHKLNDFIGSLGFPIKLATHILWSYENSYYRKIVTYHDVLSSILACSVQRWTGLNERWSSVQPKYDIVVTYFKHKYFNWGSLIPSVDIRRA